MKPMRWVFLVILGCLTPILPGLAQSTGEAAPATTPAPAATTDQAQQAINTAAAAAVASGQAAPPTSDFLEHLVDVVLGLFDVKSSGNTVTHYIIALLFLLGAYVLRHVVTKVIFAFFKKLAARTQTTLDDKLFVALEAPVATLIVVVGAVAAAKVLKLSATADVALGYASTIAFSLVVFWIVLRAFYTVLDHLHEVALARQLGLAAFMPWIKKSIVAIVVVFGGLLIAQSLGADVKAFLAGLGLGGLAFALAAQDTIANVFGSVVVAIDQPFKLGEYVRIGACEGTVEDIGLRSTKLRTGARTLIVVPNKTVAAESITNLSRMPQRRVDLTLGLTYDTPSAQMEAILGDLRGILRAERGIDQSFVVVNFTDFGASSLNIQIIFFTLDPDYRRHLELRERLNLQFMQAVAARGLALAFPTQTVEFSGEVARRLAGLPRPPAA